MAILVNASTRVVVQGITGRVGSAVSKRLLDYGTKVVAGTTPGKGGTYVHSIPVYNTVFEAVKEQGPIDASIVFVPARFATEAVYEAIDAGIKIVVVITEGIPLHDELKFVNYARQKGVIMVGPNTPGVLVPEEINLSIMPPQVFRRGGMGIMSRSGTLTFEVGWQLTKQGLGTSTALGIGGDPVTGLNFIEVYEMFMNDKETEAVILIGEIGGDAEERFAEYYKRLASRKPVVACITGKGAPPGKKMGHAGAIIAMGMGDFASKKKALEEASIMVAETPMEVPTILNNVLKR